MHLRQKISWRIEFFILLSYGLITVIYTYPLIFHFGDHVTGGFRDVWHHLWRHWYISHALLEIHHTPSYTDLIAYPIGQTIVAGDFNIFVESCFLILLRIFDITVSFNLFLFLSFILSAYGGYYLAYTIYANRRAAFLCGLIYAFNPTMTAMMHGGWVQHIFGLWMPLYILSLYHLREKTSINFKAVLVSVMFLSFAMMTSFYNGIGMVLFTVFFLVYYMMHDKNRILFIKCSAVLLMSAFILTLAMMPRIVETINYHSNIPPASTLFSADLTNFITPGEVPLQDGFHAVNRQYISTYIGIGVFLVFILGFFSHSDHRRRFWVLLAFSFFLLSLGPYLKIGGISEFELLGHKTSIVLPWKILHEVPPFYRLANHFRFNIITMLAIGMAVTPTVSNLIFHIRHVWGRNIIVLVFAIIILLEYTFIHGIPYPRELISTTVPSFYKTIGNETGNFAIAELPNGILGKSLLHQIVHHKKNLTVSFERARRYFPHYPLDLSQLLSAAKQERDKILRRLKAFRIKYVIVHYDFFPPSVDKKKARSILLNCFGSPVFQTSSVEAYRTYEALTPSVKEEAEFYYTLSLLSFGCYEYELAMERINRAIDLAGEKAKYTSMRKRILQKLEKKIRIFPIARIFHESI